VNVPVPVRKTRRVVEITTELTSLLQRDKIFARAPQQRALYELIEALGGSVFTACAGRRMTTTGCWQRLNHDTLNAAQRYGATLMGPTRPAGIEIASIVSEA